MHRDPTEFRERFKRWKAGERVYDSGQTLPAYEDGKTPEETYYGKRLPDVTIETPKVNPYVYYDGFGNAATIDSNGRRVLHDARTFNPEGFIPLKSAADYENSRLLQHKVKDPNHAYEFGNAVQDLAKDLVTAPMFDVAAEPVGIVLNKIMPKLKFVWNNGKVFQKNFPYNPRNWYRGVGEAAIKDAEETGVIRGIHKWGENNVGPYFGRGFQPHDGAPIIIEGTPESATWVDPFSKTLKVHSAEPPVNNIKLFNSKGKFDYSKLTKENGFLQEGQTFEGFPMTNGDVNATPVGNFTFYKKYPIVGYRRYSVNPKVKNSTFVTPIESRAATMTSEQLTAAQEYKNSKEYEQLLNEAAERAEAMGIPFKKEMFITGDKKTPSILIEKRAPGRIASYKNNTNTIRVDLDQIPPDELKNMMFHESLHWQRVGQPEIKTPKYKEWYYNQDESLNEELWHKFWTSEERDQLKYLDNARQYLREMTNDVLYPDADDYLRELGELQANGLEAGVAIGLKPFQPFPGLEKAIQAIEKARGYNNALNDVRAGYSEEIRNFWKVLTGNYLPSAMPFLLGGGATATVMKAPSAQQNNKDK